VEGLKVGLMPFGEALGISLPAKASLATVLIVVFLLGIGVTFAEPAIGALQTAGSLVNVDRYHLCDPAGEGSHLHPQGDHRTNSAKVGGW
jgi:hypothetical protein